MFMCADLGGGKVWEHDDLFIHRPTEKENGGGRNEEFNHIRLPLVVFSGSFKLSITRPISKYSTSG